MIDIPCNQGSTGTRHLTFWQPEITGVGWTPLRISGIRHNIHLTHYLRKKENTRTNHFTLENLSIDKVPRNTCLNILTLLPNPNQPTTRLFF